MVVSVVLGKPVLLLRAAEPLRSLQAQLLSLLPASLPIPKLPGCLWLVPWLRILVDGFSHQTIVWLRLGLREAITKVLSLPAVISGMV